MSHAEPCRAPAALTLALYDHLYPGQEAFDHTFDDAFFQFMNEVSRVTRTGCAPTTPPAD